MEESKIVEALAKVRDTKSGQSIVLRNMVKSLTIEGNDVRFTLELPTLQYEGKSEINFACIAAIQSVYPHANVHVHLQANTPTSAQNNATALPQVKNIIAVASGKGGVGKSTVASNLALGLHRLGASVGLLDADLYGPSLPTMFGLQNQRPKVQEINGRPKMLPLEAHGISLMSIGFIIEPEQAVVLRGPRLGGIIRQFIEECLWPDLDYLVIDLPPGTGDIQLTLVQTVPLTGAVIVTTPQEVAVIDAIKAMNMFLLPNVNVPILGIVENMSWFTPTELPDNKYFIFGEGGGKRLAKMSDSVLLGQIPLVQGVREGGDAGVPAILQTEGIIGETFQMMARNVMRQVALRNEILPPPVVVGLQQ